MAITMKNKVTIVTGAAGGLGVEIVKFLADMGSDIAAFDMKEVAYCADIEKDYGVRCITAACDITNPEQIEAAVKKVIDEFGRIDCLVNNAGLYGGISMLPFTELSGEEWDRVYNINVKGTWQMTKAVVPYMIEKRSGSVVNISSCSIMQGVPGFCHYVGSKGAVWAMTRTMANDMGGYNIRFNTITPGYTMTEASRSLSASPEDFERNYQRNIDDRALKRCMEATDVCGAVGFLASDASSFITGQNINVDGGSVHY